MAQLTPEEIFRIAVIKTLRFPPAYKMIEIQKGNITSNFLCFAKRGLGGLLAPDWVCWVNLDAIEHEIMFAGGGKPFGAATPDRIIVPPFGPSKWFAIDDAPAGSGQIEYDYVLDSKAPPPGGPAIIGDD